MSRKVKRLFLFKNSKSSQDKLSTTRFCLADMDIVSEAEKILEKYISSMGYKASKSNLGKKHKFIATILCALIIGGTFILLSFN